MRAYYDLEDTDWLAHVGSGAAHAISHDCEVDDAVAALHRVVEEVTGKQVERPRRRIGFVW